MGQDSLLTRAVGRLWCNFVAAGFSVAMADLALSLEFPLMTENPPTNNVGFSPPHQTLVAHQAVAGLRHPDSPVCGNRSVDGNSTGHARPL